MSEYWVGHSALLDSEDGLYRYSVIENLGYRVSVAIQQTGLPRGKRPRSETLWKTEYVNPPLADLGTVSVELNTAALRAAVKRVGGK